MSQAVALDHIGVVGGDLAALAAQYERLGFSLTPRALTADGRIANRCVMLRQGYLELMALAPGGSSATVARMLARHAGAISSHWRSMTKQQPSRDCTAPGSTVRGRNSRSVPPTQPTQPDRTPASRTCRCRSCQKLAST